MRLLLPLLRLYSLVTWVGGLLFFAFTLAPTAFHVLPAHEAGRIVGAALPILDRTGFVCGTLFLLTSFRSRPLLIPSLLIVAMLTLTAYVQAGILPTMERDRLQANGDITAASVDNPSRQDFDRLHKRSEQLAGLTLLLGLAVVSLVAVEPRRSNSL